MAIIRSKESRFRTSFDSRITRENRLSLPALGLFARLYDRPDNWSFHVRELSSSLHVPMNELQPLIEELKLAGHLVERQSKYGTVMDLIELPDGYSKEDAKPPVAHASAPVSEADDGERKAAMLFALAKRLGAQKDMPGGT